MPALKKGCENLKVHIENMRSFGIPVVVTINKFTDDRPQETDFVRNMLLITEQVLQFLLTRGKREEKDV